MPRSSSWPPTVSVKSGASSLPARARAVEIASEPVSSTTSDPPSAMDRLNSVTRCCGPWPPTTSRTARRGSAPIRAATERAMLSDFPSGATAPGVEISNCRTTAMVSMAAVASGPRPASCTALRDASPARSAADQRW
jgi:hypothetical protein